MADAEEHPRDGKDVLVAGDSVFETQALDVLLFDAEHLFNGGAGDEFDVGVGHGAVEHDL